MDDFGLFKVPCEDVTGCECEESDEKDLEKGHTTGGP